MCLALGGTNTRVAKLYGGEIHDFRSEPTAQQPDEFFRVMARQLLDGADAGNEWAVIGVPGPVSTANGQYAMGPCVNIGGLTRSYDLIDALTKVDPAYGRLQDDGFRVAVVNDGDLAAHAVAERFSEPNEQTAGALIVGTGVGFGAVERVADDSSTFRTMKFPLELGHVILDPDTMISLENSLSGTAIEQAYGMATKDMSADHSAWERVGRLIGMAAHNISVLLDIQLIVPTGGVGIGASEHFSDYLDRFSSQFAEQANSTQQLFIPRIATVPPNEAQFFELYGATSIARTEFAE